jgi:hypothetical protein
MKTKSKKVLPVASVEFRVKLVLAAVVLGFLLWVTNGHADDRLAAKAAVGHAVGGVPTNAR